MKKTIKLIAMAALCLFLSGIPSTIKAQVTALKIGGKVPDVTISNIHNYKSSTAKLSDFKGKVLILDFWATWCAACLKKFPLLDSLQAEYKEKLQVLLVNDMNTGDADGKIHNLFEKKKKLSGRGYALPYVIRDNQLMSLFPHKLLPHYVWIGGDGRVRAMTSSAELTRENIIRMLNEQPTDLALKNDLDTKKPLFLSDEVPTSGLVQYSIFLKGKIDGLGSGNLYRHDGEFLFGRAMTNTTLLGMFKSMATALLKGYNQKLLLLEVANPAALKPESGLASSASWLKENLYTLEAIVPVSQSEKLYPFMLEQLNQFSGYTGKIASRKIPSLVLLIPEGKSPVISRGGQSRSISFLSGEFHMLNRPVSSLVNSLNNIESIDLPVIDETGFAGNTDIILSGSANIPKLRRELQSQGFDLVEAEREILVFVIRDQTPSDHQ
ncbi:MAG: redoxin family protein [Daejeonella sp.]